MKSLTDLYCIFNRARGVGKYSHFRSTAQTVCRYSWSLAALISPEDLYKASQQFEALQLPFRLRRFPSGLLVVQSLDMDDDRAAQRILQHVQEQGGTITALQLAEIENLALALAQEQLIVRANAVVGKRMRYLSQTAIFPHRLQNKKDSCVETKDQQDWRFTKTDFYYCNKHNIPLSTIALQ